MKSSTVKLSLSSERKARGRLATLRDYAKLDWEAWEETDKPGPGAETMNYLGFYSRLSAAIMTRTKAELVKIASEIEDEEMDKLLAGLMDTGEMLKALASVTESAYARSLAAISAHYLSKSRQRKNVARQLAA